MFPGFPQLSHVLQHAAKFKMSVRRIRKRLDEILIDV